MTFTFKEWWDTLEPEDSELLKSKFSREAIRHFNSFYRNKDTLINKETFEQLLTNLC